MQVTVTQQETVKVRDVAAPQDAAKDGAAKKAPAAADEVVGEESPGSWLTVLASLLVWPAMCSLPLTLTLGGSVCGYAALFPASWYDEDPVQPARGEAKWFGVLLGILAVAVGQVFTLAYHVLRRASLLGTTTRVQQQVRVYDLGEGLITHLSQPEGFVLIGGYLIGTWKFGLMPSTYYSFAGGINWVHVFAQLLLQDFLQYMMHLGEHKISSWIYAHSHKAHHRFTNPRLFDAFNGSLTDTSLMIIVPFLIVCRVVPANVWSYMTFGSLYANWLVLLHSEYAHPWELVFRRIGFGTAGDHHVHHRLFTFNYGHLFMYWDRMFGTYRDPQSYAGKYFNKDV